MRQEEGSGAAEVFVADVEPAAADPLVEAIKEMGIGLDDYVLTKLDVVAPLRHPGRGMGDPGFAWVEIVGQARANSRPLARYLALINVAAVIAALGVITGSSILVVGGMAVARICCRSAPPVSASLAAVARWPSAPSRP